MPPRTQKQQTDDRFVQVHKQALADKEDVLSAIETRMSKLGTDHDLLIQIATNVSNMRTDIVKMSNCLSGPDGNDGIVSLVSANQVEIRQLRDDVDNNAKNTKIWGGSNFIAMLAAFVAAYVHGK
jgi:hypothetical protein